MVFMHNDGIHQSSRSRRFIALSLSVLCLITAVFCAFPSMKVSADENYTVDGTVADNTTDTLLYLSTSGGIMAIKIDSSTDLSTCRMLLPGKQVRVICSRGNDEYLHASKIASLTQSASSSVPSIEGAVNVSGNVQSGTTESLLILGTSGGSMQIKVDGNTNMNNCRVLTLNKPVTVTVVRGTDAYMHALAIYDQNSAYTPAGSAASASAAAAQLGSNAINGVIQKETTSELLYLNTSGGVMIFKIDASTQATNCHALIAGREIAVAWARGNDEYLHATNIVGITTGNAATTVDTGSAVTVQGTVHSSTVENLLYLNTSGGIMKIKLDSSTVWNTKFITVGQTIPVSVARGNDEYVHAVSVGAAGQGSSSSSSSGSQVTGDASIVNGTVRNGTTENLLILSTTGGDMQIKIDANTNLSICKTMIVGEYLAVVCYRGSDAYMHAYFVAGTVQPGTASVDASGAVTVSGTVAEGTRGDLLCLNTSGGMMQIKLDAATRMNTCRVLTLGRSVRVSVARGSDEYMHAIQIDAN